MMYQNSKLMKTEDDLLFKLMEYSMGTVKQPENASRIVTPQAQRAKSALQ